MRYSVNDSEEASGVSCEFWKVGISVMEKGEVEAADGEKTRDQSVTRDGSLASCEEELKNRHKRQLSTRSLEKGEHTDL